MNKLDVRHYLDVYMTRKDMQDRGITNPNEQIRKFTEDLVEKLKGLPLDEKIIVTHDAFYDSKGNVILKIPIEKGLT